jgi:nicotinamidase/pyrazinamidase
MDPQTVLRPGDALIVVDVQNDFCPGGRLAIAEGDAVVPVVNAWIAAARPAGVPVFASRDWHPVGHVSFEDQDGPWPRHCVQDSEGAAFHPALRLPEDAVVVTKGVRFDHDQNSAFDETGLAPYLQRHGIQRVWIAGLALDVCVAATALDAKAAGFETHVIVAATRPVTPEGGREALARLAAAGVHLENAAA